MRRSETPEKTIDGVSVIKAKDFDEAAAIASTCPHREYGRIDVRRVDVMGRPEARSLAAMRRARCVERDARMSASRTNAVPALVERLFAATREH